ncbi:MAG: hypothetical protein ACR2OE_19095 [Thermomicrobiales bacterium]
MVNVYGDSEGFCNPAKDAVLSITLFVDYDIYAANYDPGYQDYFYVPYENYVCGFVQFGYSIDGTSGVNPGLQSCS